MCSARWVHQSRCVVSFCVACARRPPPSPPLLFLRWMRQTGPRPPVSYARPTRASGRPQRPMSTQEERRDRSRSRPVSSSRSVDAQLTLL